MMFHRPESETVVTSSLEIVVGGSEVCGEVELTTCVPDMVGNDVIAAHCNN